MAQLHIDNLSDELLAQIRQLATESERSVGEQAARLLQQALQQETERQFQTETEHQAVPAIVARIDARRRQQPATDWLDGTALIRAERDNR